MLKLKVAFFMVSTIFIQVAMAQTLAQKKLYADEEKYLASEVESLNKRCQSNIKVSFDWTNFTNEELKERGAYGFCKEALTGVAQVCESSADGLKNVQDKIKTVSCGRETPRKIELKDNQLYFGIDYSSANDADAVQDFLFNNL